MARRGKLMKARYQKFGVVSDNDVEIFDALTAWKENRNAYEQTLRKVKEFKAQIGTLETQISNLNVQADSLKKEGDKIINSIYLLFFEKQKYAPTVAAIEKAMEEITQFKKKFAPNDFDDGGNIISKGSEENNNGRCTNIEG